MQRRHSAHRELPRRGFTLIELLLVLAIMGVLMALVVPRLVGRQVYANIDATKASISGVEQALKIYSIDHNGAIPTTSEGLEVLLKDPSGRDPRWRGPYLDDPPLDAWGQPLEYVAPGRHSTSGADISSAGPDQVLGTEDDITNWGETLVTSR